MADVWTLPTKNELGAGYLAGAGVALIVSLLGYAWYTRESLFVVAIVVSLAFLLFSTIVYLGYVFMDFGTSEELVWTVAQWVALGFGISVVFAAAVTYVREQIPDVTVVPGLIVTTIATLVLLCSMLGVVSGLRAQHRRLLAVNQRNSVMNRVLRHNIKNAMNVIRGHADLLERTVGDTPQESISAIDRSVEEILSMSEAARRIDRLETSEAAGPIDVASMVRKYGENAAETFPDAEITVEVPEAAWADAGPIVRSAVHNLVENAVEHHDREVPARVSTTVRATNGWVTVAVADNGPGIPQGERDILLSAEEQPTRHGGGLGLWLVQWVADHFGGTLDIAENEPRGTVVTLRLPAAEPPAAD